MLNAILVRCCDTTQNELSDFIYMSERLQLVHECMRAVISVPGRDFCPFLRIADPLWSEAIRITLIFYAEPMQKNRQICKDEFRYPRLNCLNISTTPASPSFEGLRNPTRRVHRLYSLA
jgi:hypothetical protein